MKKLAVCAFLLIGVLLFFNAADAQTRNKALDEIIDSTTVKGVPLINGYTIESGSAYIQMNPVMWNTFSRDQQRQLCDSLAASWQAKGVGLINGWLLIHSTKIGRIAPRISGEYQFIPEN